MWPGHSCLLACSWSWVQCPALEREGKGNERMFYETIHEKWNLSYPEWSHSLSQPWRKMLWNTQTSMADMSFWNTHSSKVFHSVRSFAQETNGRKCSINSLRVTQIFSCEYLIKPTWEQHDLEGWGLLCAQQAQSLGPSDSCVCTPKQVQGPTRTTVYLTSQPSSAICTSAEDYRAR